MAEAGAHKCLEFQISNQTQNITLMNPRWDKAFQSCPPLRLELPPGSSDSCEFFRLPGYRGTNWLVLYEADSFTLAAFLIIPREPDVGVSVLQLEVSRDKAHLGDVGRTLSRVTWLRDPPEAEQTVTARGAFLHYSGGSLNLLAGPYKVTAGVSRHLWNPDVSVSVLQLEVSRDKAHLGDVGRTLSRVTWLRDPPEAEQTVTARGAFLHYSGGSLNLLAGPYKVTAGVSRYPKSALRVKLEDRGRS